MYFEKMSVTDCEGWMDGLPGRDAGADEEETSSHRCVGLALRGEVCAGAS